MAKVMKISGRSEFISPSPPLVHLLPHISVHSHFLSTSLLYSVSVYATALRADLTKEEDVINLAKEITRREGKLHVLVNNSGTNWAQPIDEYSLKGWDKVYK